MSDPRPESSEKQIQAGIVRLLKMRGFAVYNLSQARASKQTAGLPDCIALGMGKTLFVEVKRRPNKPTAAQLDFGANVADAEGEYVVWYSVEDAMQWIKDRRAA